MDRDGISLRLVEKIRYWNFIFIANYKEDNQYGVFKKEKSLFLISMLIFLPEFFLVFGWRWENRLHGHIFIELSILIKVIQCLLYDTFMTKMTFSLKIMRD